MSSALIYLQTRQKFPFNKFQISITKLKSLIALIKFLEIIEQVNLTSKNFNFANCLVIFPKMK